MIDFDKQELEELKRAVNTLIGERIRYKIIESNENRVKASDEYLDMDYKILEKIIIELDK
jgi:hypothetical protein